MHDRLCGSIEALPQPALGPICGSMGRSPRGRKTCPPPTPFYHLLENTALNCLSFLHPKKTKELQTPIRRRNRHFAPSLRHWSEFFLRGRHRFADLPL
jgi:hypothetical protein